MATTRKTTRKSRSEPEAERTEAFAASGDEIVSTNPATLEEVGRVSVTPVGDLDAIVEQARAAQRRWSHVPLRERAKVVQRAANWLYDNHEHVATLLTRENGKTIVESYVMEVFPVLDMWNYTAKHGPAILARERIPTPQLFLKHKRHYFDYTPLGVVGIVAPWNYPFSIPSGDAAIALLAGNAVIIKPSPLTPLIAEEVRRAFVAAGLPDGLLAIVHGDAPLGAAMCAHPGIDKIVFTGSVETGRRVGEACAAVMKPFVLELGGKDAAIVLDDADVDRAVRGVLWGGIANCGQTCAGIERVYVHRNLHDEFVSSLSARASGLQPGDPMDPATQIGPFTDPRQYDTVVRHVDEAVSLGASLLTGGPVDPGLPGKFYAPAVVRGVDHSMSLMREETFGPVIPVMPFDDERDAIKLANDSEYGLGASIWTRNTARASKLAEELEAGSVWVNDHMYSFAVAELPWGGVKRSGIGVAHSKFGFYEMVRPKLLALDSGKVPVAWWHPYDERLRNAMHAVISTLYSPSTSEKLRNALGRREAFKGLLDRVRHPE